MTEDLHQARGGRGEVPDGGDHDQRGPAGVERRVDRLDNPADEVPGAAVYRGHLPQGAWRAPLPERVEERSARRVGGQHRRRGRLERLGPDALGGLLRAGVARRHRKPGHVGEGAGVVVRDRPDEAIHGGGHDGFARDDLAERRERLDVGLFGELDDPAALLLAAEADLDPRADDRVVRELVRNLVVEEPVKV